MQYQTTIQKGRVLVHAPSILVWLVLLVLCACTGAGRTMAEPAPPPGATLPYPSDGPLMTAALFTLADFRSRLQTHYKQPFDAHRYAVPATTRWSTITEHYTHELGPDWQVDTRYAEKPGDSYRSMVWTDGEHMVAIALNESPHTSTGHALTVLFL